MDPLSRPTATFPAPPGFDTASPGGIHIPTRAISMKEICGTRACIGWFISNLILVLFKNIFSNIQGGRFQKCRFIKNPIFQAKTGAFSHMPISELEFQFRLNLKLTVKSQEKCLFSKKESLREAPGVQTRVRSTWGKSPRYGVPRGRILGKGKSYL